MKKEATDLEKICGKYISDQELVYRMHKELSKENKYPKEKKSGQNILTDLSHKRYRWQISP